MPLHSLPLFHRLSGKRVVVMCRRGNDSQAAAKLLMQAGAQNVWDLKGGLHEWARTCAADMPVL